MEHWRYADMPVAMSAQQLQDIMLYCAKGFNTKQTRDAMLLDACKLHGFQTHSVPSFRPLAHPPAGPAACNDARAGRGNPRVGLAAKRRMSAR